MKAYQQILVATGMRSVYIFFAVIAGVHARIHHAHATTDRDREAMERAEEAASGFIDRLEDAIVFPLITLLLAIAFLMFLYGVFEYIKGAASETERATGQRHMLFGLIGMIVMLCAVTILTIARGTFGI
jgi:fatty acid desaturase